MSISIEQISKTEITETMCAVIRNPTASIPRYDENHKSLKFC